MVAVCWVRAPALCCCYVSESRYLYLYAISGPTRWPRLWKHGEAPSRGWFPEAPVDGLGLREEPPGQGARLTAL
jgi:hypothetical protein